jgi:hypothetical protein
MSVNIQSIQFANFENLLAVYYNGTAADKAAYHLDTLIFKNQQEQIATLLRDHRKEKISSPNEISLRAATDRLMKCYSIMEIASLTNFIPEIQSTDFGLQALAILEHEDVRRYYENFYPEKNTQLFRYRLEGVNCVVGEKIGSNFSDYDYENPNQIFMAFMSLDNGFMETLDDGYLLRMLDSFKIDKYRFSDVVELISNPNDFINCLLIAPIEHDVMSKTLLELGLFIQFCFDLQQLLLKSQSYSLIQSAIWNHYGYWFNIIGEELSNQLGKALSKFLEWQPMENKDVTVKDIQDYVHKANTVLKFLTTSMNFARPIDNLLKIAVNEKNIVTTQRVKYEFMNQ